MTVRAPLRAACACALGAWLAGCAAAPVAPLDGGAGADAPSDEEARLWREADRFDAAIVHLGTLLPDPAVTAYVQGIMDRLYPDFAGRIHVHVVRTPELNAFALPNGTVYVHLGMLARLDSEAQIASVLAHEGAHFVNRHALRQRRTVKRATILAAAGIPALGQLAAASSIFGYSRELEREADEVGFARLKRAGYAASEAVPAFEHLKAEVEALGIDEPYFFASHPRLRERIESFSALAAASPDAGGEVGREAYLARTAALRVQAVEADLARDRYPSVILVLEAPEAADRFPPHATYYLGEAYRLRDGEGDVDRARSAYEEAVRRAPGFAPAYRALGERHMKDGEDAAALKAFETFLRLAPDNPAAPYVRQYLTTLGTARGAL